MNYQTGVLQVIFAWEKNNFCFQIMRLLKSYNYGFSLKIFVF